TGVLAGIEGSIGDGGSAGDITRALGGSIEHGGSLEGITDALAGSITDSTGSGTDPDTGLLGSVTGGYLTQGIVGSLGAVTNSVAGPETGLLGSLTGNGGSTGQSSDTIDGSVSDSTGTINGSVYELTGVNGSLTAFTGSLENGSLNGTASAD